MAGRFRVVDTGVREGRFNIAVDQAMIELHLAGGIVDTFRFMRFPPTALIGRHQALSQEIDVPHCLANGVGIVRRITGGGAIYLDEGQLGWGLIFHHKALGAASLPELARDIYLAVAAGLRRLGVDARYRPRNDIEVDGRKISGTGGFFDGETLIYQGTVLVDMDPAAMVPALRVPLPLTMAHCLPACWHGVCLFFGWGSFWFSGGAITASRSAEKLHLA